MSPPDDMMNCPNCGELIKSKAIICRFCQRGLSREHFRECHSCSELVRNDATICRYCHSEFSNAQPPNDPEKESQRRGRQSDRSYGRGGFGSGVRAQVFEVIVRQALAGAPWREICAGPMSVNNISPEEIEKEVLRRKLDLNDDSVSRRESSSSDSSKSPPLTPPGIKNSEAVSRAPMESFMDKLNSIQEAMLNLQHMIFASTKDPNHLANILAKMQSEPTIWGSLSVVEPATLLQNVANVRETGELSIQRGKLQFLGLYEGGRITHALLGKLKGNDAVVELVSSWSDGTYAFCKLEKTISHETCRLTHPLEKLLLISSQAHESIQSNLSVLPGKHQSILERSIDSEQKWQELASTALRYVDGIAVTDADKLCIADILSSLSRPVKLDALLEKFDQYPSHFKIKAIRLLLDYKMISATHC